jgi:hypothetical protein
VTGVISFYDWGGGKISHVNAGVGQKDGEKAGQVVDATEGGWMTGRNDNPNQAVPAGPGQVNQTYEPYSTNTAPVSQGQINFDALDQNYRGQ